MTSIQIVSGGQTGVDRAALDAALVAGIPCGGWCPRGRRAEDGEIADGYPLKETASRGYVARTKANVHDSDATLIIVQGPDGLSGGTRMTVDEAKRLARNVLIVDLSNSASHEEQVGCIAAWVADHEIATLNVAGPRESKSPGIYHDARSVVADVIITLTL